MAKQTPLHTLIDLASNNVDEATKQLQRLTSNRNEAAQQLSVLQNYRQDYAERLQLSTQSGLSASNYHNFRQFILTLDDAILQQNKIVVQMDAKLESGRKQWQDEKRRLSSYETLLSRQMRQQAVREQRREQRATDEISARLYLRAHSTH